MIEVIAFDADDTLWHNEVYYARTEAAFARLLAPYGQEEGAADALLQTERANVPNYYGYGIKGFALSMIETAIRVTAGQIQAQEIQTIIDLAKAMLDAPVELLDGVADVIPDMAGRCTLWLITKGDLRDQQIKLTRSGLAEHFAAIEIVPEKSVETYRDLLARHGVAPQKFLMVGNSLRSDILPVLELGGHAVHIPYHITWAHEQVPVAPEQEAGYVEFATIRHLPPHVQALCRSAR
jgi:putative hydrolase of the HAD superfamily